MKKSKIGWLKDESYFYDLDSGKNPQKKGKAATDETLKDFDFHLQGDIGNNRIVLGLPLIAPKKEFWNRSSQKAIKVKVTIELIREDEKVTEVRIGRNWGKGKAVFRGTDPIMIRKYKT